MRETLLALRGGHTSEDDLARALGINKRAVKARIAELYGRMDLDPECGEGRKIQAITKAILEGIIPPFE